MLILQVSIDDRPLRDSCKESEDSEQCVQRDSTMGDEGQRFACCCSRRWSESCREALLEQLKTLLGDSGKSTGSNFLALKRCLVIAKKPEQIMSELTKDPLMQCDEADKTKEGHTSTEFTRPCERNEGCYTSVHARDVPATTHHQHVGVGMKTL